MIKTDKHKLNVISQTIFDKKGFNILALDVRGISTLTDYFIIAEGNVNRHVQSICTAIKDSLEDIKLKVYHIDGERDGEWVVIDMGEIVVHLFTPDTREKYAIEELWKQSKIVDVEIDVSKIPPVK